MVFFFNLMLLYYFFSLPIGILVGLFIKFLNFSETEFNYNAIKIILAGLIIGPIIEEILFRLLLKPRYWNVLLFFAFSISMMIVSIIKSNVLYLLIFTFLGCITLILCKKKTYLKAAQKFILRRFYFAFYLSCFLFSLIHFTNYHPASYKLLLSMPLIILPQFIGGAFLGFVRMKYGIKYSFLFHSITNIFPVLVLVFDK